MSEELKPCPFCGEPAHEELFDIDLRFPDCWTLYIGCNNSDCLVDSCSCVGMEDARDELVKNWNTRKGEQK